MSENRLRNRRETHKGSEKQLKGLSPNQRITKEPKWKRGNGENEKKRTIDEVDKMDKCEDYATAKINPGLRKRKSKRHHANGVEMVCDGDKRRSLCMLLFLFFTLLYFTVVFSFFLLYFTFSSSYYYY